MTATAAETMEMDDLNQHEASRPLLRDPEVVVVQPDNEQQEEGEGGRGKGGEGEGGGEGGEGGEEARKKRTEKEMDEALDFGDVEEIKKFVTPQKLTECTANCVEKSFEVSHRLRNLGRSRGTSAKEFNDLATQVEDFALKMLEPVRSDDVKRAIFKEKFFDRVSDKALRYRQKKFVSHPLYSLLLKERWLGYFYQLIYNNVKKNLLELVFINFWTFFDVLLFPLVHVLLWLIRWIIEFAKKRQDLSVYFLLYDRGQAREQIKLQKTADHITNLLEAEGILRQTFIRGKEVQLPSAEDQEVEGSKKVLVAITTGVRYGRPSNQLLEEVTSLKEKLKVRKVIFVGFIDDVHLNHHCTHFKETMTTNDANVFLIFDGDKDGDKKEVIKEIVKCIKGKDIYDRYYEYFTTPYFIFFRDTLSYLALLGLHFVMCLQPSTVHFTVVEWIISVFFLGRLMMEINQMITENWEQEAEKTSKKEEKERSWKKLWKDMSAFSNDWWNKLDIITLIVFLVLVGLRAFIWLQHSSISKNRLLAVAGYLYGLNAMFLTLRVFGHIMEYKKSTGSIQIALFHVMRAVLIVLGQFVATTLAFSLAVTKIYIAEVSYSSGRNETSSGLCKSQSGLDCWWGFTKYLTWSLLGIAELTPLQSSDDTSDLFAKILYGLFLIMGVVMLMNMMIALLSHTYQQVQDNAFYEWSYKKATTIRTYTKYHPVPVPFNIISMSFILLRHIYRKINCTKCKRNKPRHEAQPEEPTNKEKMLWYRLQVEYFAKYGQRFPSNAETESNRKMIGYIAERTFLNDQEETEQTLQRRRRGGGGGGGGEGGEGGGEGNEWQAKGIAIIGQRLEYDRASCRRCPRDGEVNSHTARYLSPLSEECPAFEVLIQEIGDKRVIAIGVVTEKHNFHKLPGWERNTLGYHIDNGKIFGPRDHTYGKMGVDAIAYRGDLIGCKILYDQQEDGKLPVSFTLNGRVVGQAEVDLHDNNNPGPFYPCVGIGWKGISCLFRLCPRTETVPVVQDDDTFPEQQTQRLSFTPSPPDTKAVIQMFESISKRLTQLERKIDHLSRSEPQKP